MCKVTHQIKPEKTTIKAFKKLHYKPLPLLLPTGEVDIQGALSLSDRDGIFRAHLPFLLTHSGYMSVGLDVTDLRAFSADLKNEVDDEALSRALDVVEGGLITSGKSSLLSNGSLG